MVQSTTQYTSGGNIFVVWGNSPSGPKATQNVPGNTLTSLTNNQMMFIPGGPASGVPVTSINETAIYLTNDIANFATGDGDFLVQISYRVIASTAV
jgi:dTDP-4-dehydrorhamnose 3,5-epimerase-like enzyme